LRKTFRELGIELAINIPERDPEDTYALPYADFFKRLEEPELRAALGKFADAGGVACLYDDRPYPIYQPGIKCHTRLFADGPTPSLIERLEAAIKDALSIIERLTVLGIEDASGSKHVLDSLDYQNFVDRIRDAPVLTDAISRAQKAGVRLWVHKEENSFYFAGSSMVIAHMSGDADPEDLIELLLQAEHRSKRR
jgi:hypothetical protein